VLAAERDVSPTISHFATGSNGTAIGSESASALVTVANNHGSLVMNVAPITLGGDASQFNKKADNCSGQSVAAGDSCTFEVSYKPTQLGSRLAYASIVTTIDGVDETLTAFFSNDEDNQTQSKRRLPAVLNVVKVYEGADTTGALIDTSLTELTAGQQYTVYWVLLGYGDSYESNLVHYQCTAAELADESCAASSGGSYATNVSFVESELSGWSYLGQFATFYAFQATFTAPANADDVVAFRFFYRADDDIAAAAPELSLLAPGNLSRLGGTASGYIGNDGRRLYFNLQ
jgi:hypothetical protein